MNSTSSRSCLLLHVLTTTLFVFCAAIETLAQRAVPPIDQALSVNNGPDLAVLADASAAAAISPTPFPPPVPTRPALTSGVGIIHPVQATVEVNAGEQALRYGLAVPFHVTQADVLSAAGTWGDFTRYLQVLPGVVWNSDISNDVMVRGGHPSENLYVVDGIEVPNINHLAMEGTTGGFTSMIDTAAISSMDMKSGVYDARYSSRLSSLIEIHTRESQETEGFRELDFGIAGMGGILERPIGKTGSLLFSGHRSVLNFFTDNIGLNGTPVYTNGLAQFGWSPSKKDHISALSITGADSIAVKPCPGDPGETLLVETQYGGIRSTDGLVWQHVHGPTVASVLTGSYSTQNQNIGQQLQNPGSSMLSWNTGNYCQPSGLSNIYQERTHDGISTLKYNLQIDRHGWFVSLGTSGRLQNMDYSVNQPVGQQSPLSSDPSWTNAHTFARNIWTGETGTFAEATGHLGTRWTVLAGAREETFSLTGAHVFEPRTSLALRISEHQTVNAGYSRMSQMAPSINILSYTQNAHLLPLRVEEFSAGADLWRGNWGTASVEAYHKRYWNEPVSTEFPTLMLANMVDTLGQQFVWIPLRSGGKGQAKGVEFLLRAHWASHFQFLGSTSYSRTQYAAADGVMRPGNFDFPLMANGLGTVFLPMALELSLRNTYATGRPYTPFNVPISLQQARGVYDLTRVNSVRGPAYNRFDLSISRRFHIRKRIMVVHAGVENVLDRHNYLGEVWLPRCIVTDGKNAYCVSNGVPEQQVNQMPIFPSGGLRYQF